MSGLGKSPIGSGVLTAVLTLLGHGAEACRLALVLAMDVSSSVSAEEDALQRGGLAAALMAPPVQAAMFSSKDPVALAAFEWSGQHNQLILQDWILVDSPTTLVSIAGRIAATQRSHDNYPTALGYALGYAATLLRRAPDCAQRKIDVSGDGLNNDGFSPRDAYRAFDFEGITVNGLIINVPETAAKRENPDDLLDYYATEVIRGPAAFVEVADGFEDFARAMELKLIRELGVLMLGRTGQSPRQGADG